ncbi:hypothetical protein [Aquimarina macrocephali]|uniref:hypothetical protein n=1 Tax=Aquimarina macrocephali TaxID=666563 RepID=UPI003F668E49
MKTLEDRITSLRAITCSVIFYIIGYAVKLSVLLSGILQEIVTNEYLKIITSSFTGLALATGLLIVSVNERHKSIPYIIASMDAVALLLVFKIFEAKDWMEISTAIFISVFMAFVGYHLIDTFSAKYRQQKNKQRYSDLQQELSKREQRYSELEQKINELEQLESEAEERVKATTCPKCNQNFGSKNALNAHIGKCKVEKIEVEFEELKQK